jgi:hypothetical protein
MVLSVLVAMNSLKPVRQRAVTPSTVGESAHDEQRSSDKDNQQRSFCHGVILREAPERAYRPLAE